MHAYERQVAEELQELRSYLIQHNLENDDFAKQEIARLTDSLDDWQRKPRAFILVISRAGDNFDAYLGFGAAVAGVRRITFGDATVIEIPAEHAEWQAQRLHSGLYGASIFQSEAEAAKEIERLNQNANQ